MHIISRIGVWVWWACPHSEIQKRRNPSKSLYFYTEIQIFLYRKGGKMNDIAIILNYISEIATLLIALRTFKII